MKKNQARGYVLERILSKLLQINGYEVVVDSRDTGITKLGNGFNIQGRGGIHQFDSLGTFQITAPFTYPIRLFLEAKFHAEPIGIDNVRMGIGILHDINTNYMTLNLCGKKLLEQRYNYNYVIFSTAGFSSTAQRLALAHKIQLVDISSSRFDRIKDRVVDITDRIFGTREEIRSEEFWRCLNSSSHFREQLRGLNHLYIASANTPQVIVLVADDDQAFRESLLANPHQEVIITWDDSEDEGERNLWHIRPANNTNEYCLSFQLSPEMARYIFGDMRLMYDRALNAKQRYFDRLTFIAYLGDSVSEPTLCTLKYNAQLTKRYVKNLNRE